MSLVRKVEFTVDLEQVSPEQYKKLMQIVERFSSNGVKTKTFDSEKSNELLSQEHVSIVKWFPPDKE